MVIVRESIDFKRGQPSKKGLDVGMDSSRFWPKNYKDLNKKEKEKALDNFRDWWNDTMHGGADDFITSDQFLLEPAHVLLKQKFGKNPYEVMGVEPLIDFDADTLYYNVSNKTVNVEDSIQINDNEVFLQFLGISDDLIPEVYFTIKKDGIDFEENDSQYEFTKSDLKQLSDATHIFDKYLNDLAQTIQDNHEYYYSDEMLKDHISSNNTQFDSEYNIAF